MGYKRFLRLSRFWFGLSLVVLSSGLTTKPLNAQVRLQVPPQDIVPRQPTPVPSPLPPPQNLLQPPQPTPTPLQAVPSGAPGNITVQRFEVVGSTVFNPGKLAQVLAPFTRRPISFAELLQARDAITKLYTDQGYITSGAYIPLQSLQSGVVKIQVVEGGLEDIKVTGTRRLNPNYVRSRVALGTSKPLNQKRLLEALQLLQLNPLIKNLSADLSAGTRQGVSLLEVQVTEAKTFSTPITLDNAQLPTFGSFRRQIQLNEANLLGQGDGISLAYTNTDGSDTLDTSYTFPINPRNGTLSLSYINTWNNVIERPFNALDITANARYYDLTLRQPLVQNPTQEFAIGLTGSRRESDITFLRGLPFPEPGSDARGRTRISAVRFFQEWSQRNSQEVIALRSEFSLGIDALGVTINKGGPDNRFFAWRGQGQWVRLLAPDTLLVVRGNLQLADRPLVPLEQFGLGGINSVRGYRQDYLLTDNGAFASAEVRVPILRISRNDVLQLAPFVDAGAAWNNSRGILNPNSLASIGLGLRWQVGDRLTARFDWGIPLVHVNLKKRTWQENGLYFSIVYNPF